MIVGCGLWKAIGNRWVVFKSITCFIVGNGRKMKFFKDRWCGENSLEKSCFGVIFYSC